MTRENRSDATADQTTSSAIEHFARQPPDVSDDALEAVYFHIVAAEEPAPLGDGCTPPADARVWTAEDWFEVPAQKMFAPAIGDCQPRDGDGNRLTTAERLAVTAAAASIGRTPIGTWVWASAESRGATFWMDANATGRATLVGNTSEAPETAAMRDLPGKDGYGRSRGTEHIDRPSQAARVTALALHGKEIREASGIEIVREPRKERTDGREAPPGDGAGPELAYYRDGGVRATLDAGYFSQPTTPDLIDEIAAVAISRAWQSEHAEAKRGNEPASGKQQRIERATIAGLIASHHLVQSAGVHSVATEWGERVTEWVDRLKQHRPEQARYEMRRTVELTRRLEYDLRLPRSPREIERGTRRAAARGNEEPTRAASPEHPTKTAPTQSKTRGASEAAGHVNPVPPRAPGPATEHTTAQNQQRARVTSR